MLCFYHLHQKVDSGIGGLFERYGKFVARHPWKTVILVGIINAALGVGLLELNPESGINQYVPIGNTASKDQQTVSFARRLVCTYLFNIKNRIVCIYSIYIVACQHVYHFSNSLSCIFFGVVCI